MILDITKVALSSYDDKWFIYKDEEGEIQYLPYGHSKIAELENNQESEESEEEMR